MLLTVFAFDRANADPVGVDTTAAAALGASLGATSQLVGPSKFVTPLPVNSLRACFFKAN